MNFATLQGLTIPEGVVTQITDASGRVLWAAQTGNEPAAIFEVTKLTSNTYVGETLYPDEQFILLDIYPKTNGTVKVTYGGLTKTITDTSGAEEPNAQQVFFGTFNGVSDEVETPTSGTLKIEGAYRGYGAGAFTEESYKVDFMHCNCVDTIVDFGNPVYIGDGMFASCDEVSVVVPDGVEFVGSGAFYGCSNLVSLTLPATLKGIGGTVAYMINSKITVTVLATNPPVWDGTVYGPSNASGFNLVYEGSGTIAVLKGCGEAYKAADGWSTLASIITEAS